MAALYPKKMTPFNATAARNFEKLNLSPGMYTEIVYKLSLGPGSYEKKSDFEKTLIMHGVPHKETFLIKDNGHLNQRVQQYAHHNRKVTTLQMANPKVE